MKIADNTVATLQFRLTDSEGNEIHTTTDDDPMVYLHGSGELIEGLENAMAGKAAGDEFDVVIDPDNGYGDIDENLVRVFHKDDFGDADMRVGMELQGKDPEGNFRLLRVIKVEGDDVTVDMNHPLAGKTLTFSVNITDVRAATEAEIAHGHAHMPGEDQPH